MSVQHSNSGRRSNQPAGNGLVVGMKRCIFGSIAMTVMRFRVKKSDVRHKRCGARARQQPVKIMNLLLQHACINANEALVPSCVPIRGHLPLHPRQA